VFVLDWMLVSVSLFNAIILLWLALTIALNAERSTWGSWLVFAGLLLGALFFISHTIIAGHELTAFGSRNLELWWRIGWIPVVLTPFAWYVIILWYAGFWEQSDSRLHRRHRWGLAVVLIFASGLLGLMVVAHPLPTYMQLTVLDLSHTTAWGRFPVMFILYPPFSVLCILLPLDALRYSEPSRRMMGDLARQRARPWLILASAALLTVAVLLTVFMVWVYGQYSVRATYIFGVGVPRAVVVFDILLESLIGGAVVLLGQSMVSYEIFTGKVLPQRGFFRQWRSTILLAAILATTVGYTLIWQPLPVFSLTLATVVMVVLYALFGWRNFKHREEFFARLRPFVSSQEFMRHLVTAEDDSASRTALLFQAICEEVLGAGRAVLIPLGALAPLAGPPLTYPHSAEPPDFRLTPDRLIAAASPIVALDPAEYGGLEWGVPLWSERGLIGALLFGPKQDGGLYTQEEIEIARASAERVIDLLAGEQVARRLVELQRRRFAETRVVDLRTRRALHDDILPALHTAVLKLSGLARTEPAAREAIQTLTALHQQISDLIHTSAGSALPLAGPDGLAGALRQMIQLEYAEAFNAVTWQIADGVPPLDPLIREVLIGAAREAVRNAALHGRGDQAGRALKLWIGVEYGERLAITVRDDGVGLSYRAAAARPLAGSGGGLTLHSTMLAVIGGELIVESLAEGGTQVRISLPSKVVVQ
jgi:signal transduction histidine kinase